MGSCGAVRKIIPGYEKGPSLVEEEDQTDTQDMWKATGSECLLSVRI